MKYMLLIYSDENAWTDGQREDCFAESVQLTHELHAKGQFWGRRRSNPLRWLPACAFATANRC